MSEGTCNRVLALMARAIQSEVTDWMCPPEERDALMDLWAEISERAAGRLVIRYHHQSRVLRLFGTPWTTDLFRDLACLPVDKCVQIIARKGDGVLWLKTLEEHPEDAFKRGLAEGLAARPPCPDCEEEP